MTGDLRAGVAQWTPGRDPDVNLRKAEAALRELARRGCQLAVLPELWLCGYRAASLGADARAVAEPADGPVQQRLAAVARVTGMVICAGTFPELDGGHLYNTAAVYGPDGNPLLRHRKAFLYGTEPEVFRPGNAVTAGDIAGIGRVGLCVCFDGDFPETARSLRARGRGYRAAPVGVRDGRRELVGHHLPRSGAVQRPVVDLGQPARRVRRRPHARRQPDHRPGRPDGGRRAPAPRSRLRPRTPRDRPGRR